MRRFNDKCDVQSRLAAALAPEEQSVASNYVLRHHARVLRRAAGSGNIACDWYPHPIGSCPFRFNDFRNFDLSTMTAYLLVDEAKCIGVADGRVIKMKELNRDEARFSL